MRTQIGINELLACIDSFINLGRSAQMDEDGNMYFAETDIFDKLFNSYVRVCKNCTVDEDNYAFVAAFALIRRFTRYLSDIAENDYTIPDMFVLVTWLPLLSEANDNKYRLLNIKSTIFPYFKLITLVNNLGLPIVVKYHHPVEGNGFAMDVFENGKIVLVATSPELYFQFEIEQMAFESKPIRISVDNKRNFPMYHLKSTKQGFVVELNEYSD